MHAETKYISCSPLMNFSRTNYLWSFLCCCSGLSRLLCNEFPFSLGVALVYSPLCNEFSFSLSTVMSVISIEPRCWKCYGCANWYRRPLIFTILVAGWAPYFSMVNLFLVIANVPVQIKCHYHSSIYGHVTQILQNRALPMCVVVVSYAINRGILVVWSMFKGMPYAFYVLFAPGCLQCKRGEGDLLRIRYGGGSGGYQRSDHDKS